MRVCPEYESLLIDRAAGELSEEDRIEVERHLAECRVCAAKAEAFEKTLRAIALPARSAEERAALASLGRGTATAWRRGERTRSRLQGVVAGVVASAAAASLILFPTARRATANGHRSDPAIAALERWASPLPFAADLREAVLELGEADAADEGEL